VYFPADDSAEWLSRVDAVVCLAILKELRESNLPPEDFRALEIGVWKGAWISVMLKNEPTLEGVGVDPYPGGAAFAQKILMSRLQELGVHRRFVHYRHVRDVKADARFALVHIDGEHSEEAVSRDLVFAKSVLHEDGVIVVDDFRHRAFPGIPSAMFRFCEAEGIRLFLVSDSKAYLSRSSAAPDWYARLLARLPQCSSLVVHRYYGDGDESSVLYPQSTDVLGQPVLLVSRTPKRRSEERQKLRHRVLRLLLPPLFFGVARRLRGLVRT